MGLIEGEIMYLVEHREGVFIDARKIAVFSVDSDRAAFRLTGEKEFIFAYKEYAYKVAHAVSLIDTNSNNDLLEDIKSSNQLEQGVDR